MCSFDLALGTVLRAVTALESEIVSTMDCDGRVTAEDILAPDHLPAFDNTAMDGFAVRAEDCAAGVPLEVTDFIPAGASTWPALEAGKAIRVMTGAAIPQNADTVVPLEDTQRETDGRVRMPQQVKLGQHVRRAGEDVRKDEVLLAAGTPIGVAEINLLAALGFSSLPVHRKPRVAILATGDELVALGGRLTSGKIFDSNSLTLAASVKSCGAEPVMLGIARDDRESLNEKLQEGLKADALITAAGVSVGDRDLVREVLGTLGAEEVFWGVKMKPGKATAFAMLAGKPIFSVPGNPVSAMITFEELVRPALLRMGGRRRVVRSLATAVLQDGIRKKAGRVFFARVALKLVDGKLLAWSAGKQDTGFQRTMLNADGIAVLPEESAGCGAGELVQVHVLSPNFGLMESHAALPELARAINSGGDEAGPAKG